MAFPLTLKKSGTVEPWTDKTERALSQCCLTHRCTGVCKSRVLYATWSGHRSSTFRILAELKHNQGSERKEPVIHIITVKTGRWHVVESSTWCTLDAWSKWIAKTVWSSLRTISWLCVASLYSDIHASQYSTLLWLLVSACISASINVCLETGLKIAHHEKTQLSFCRLYLTSSNSWVDSVARFSLAKWITWQTWPRLTDLPSMVKKHWLGILIFGSVQRMAINSECNIPFRLLTSPINLIPVI